MVPDVFYWLSSPAPGSGAAACKPQCTKKIVRGSMLIGRRKTNARNTSTMLASFQKEQLHEPTEHVLGCSCSRRSARGTTPSEALPRRPLRASSPHQWPITTNQSGKVGMTRPSSQLLALRRGFASRVFGARQAFDTPVRRAALVMRLARRMGNVRAAALRGLCAEMAVFLRRNDRAG